MVIFARCYPHDSSGQGYSLALTEVDVEPVEFGFTVGPPTSGETAGYFRTEEAAIEAATERFGPDLIVF